MGKMVKNSSLLDDMWGNLPNQKRSDDSPFKILNKQSDLFNKKYKVIKTRLEFVEGANNTQSVFRYKLILYTEFFSFEVLYVVYGSNSYPCRLKINKVIYREIYGDKKNRFIYIRDVIEFNKILEKVLTSSSIHDIINTLL